MMKLKRKSLALMVSITCSGLLYGANANAEAVEGFGAGTASEAFTAITGVLSAGSLGAADNHLSADKGAIGGITDVSSEKKAKVTGFDAYMVAAKSANSANTDWYNEFNTYLNTRDKDNDGLLAAIAGDLNTGEEESRVLVTLGDNPQKITSAAEAADMVLDLIQAAQDARQTDQDRNDGKETAFNEFLSANKTNLNKLDISENKDGTEVLKDSGQAKDTFMHFVDLKTYSDGEAPAISVRQVRENLTFLKGASEILTADVGSIPSKMATRGKTTSEQTDGGSTKDGELTAGLKDKSSDAIVAAKGTKLEVKGNAVSFNGTDLKADAHGIAYVKDRDGKEALVKLGQIAVTDSNVQGSGNTVVAKSAAVFNKDGDFVNPAEGITAYGNKNTIESGGIAVGNSNTVTENGTVIGNGSQATKNNAIAVGNNAVADGENSIALGSDSRAEGKNEVNVGIWTANKDGKTYSQTGTRIIGGVGTGVNDTDAVNYKQLKDAETRSGNLVSGLRQEMNSKVDALDKKVSKGFAANAALSGLFQPYGVGKINMTAGVGGYQSESAVAVGVGYRINENVAVKGGIATAVGNGSSTMYNASVNFEW